MVKIYVYFNHILTPYFYQRERKSNCLRLKYADIVRILKFRLSSMVAYFNLRQLLFLLFWLKYTVKIWLKYTHIFTLRAASYLSCALRLLASTGNVWTLECRGTALQQTSDDSCKRSRLAASLLLCFSPSPSWVLAYSSAWTKEVCGTAPAQTEESLLQKTVELFRLWTKEGGRANAREPDIQKKDRSRIQGFLLLGISTFISLRRSA